MERRNPWLLATISLCLLAATTAAQVPRMEPGEAHRRLDFLVGDWTLESRMYMGDEVHTAEHSAEIRWLPGGVWLEERVEMPGTPIGDIFGSARIAWDEGAGEYARSWIDNQSHVVLSMRGRPVDASTLEFRGVFDWIDGTVFHQRLVLRKEEGGGWSQMGYMGRDPDDLRRNHEARAVRREPAAAAVETQPDVAEEAAPPTWLREHMEFMARDGGRWIADNGAHESDAEPFDSYGTEWTWGPGKQSLSGRLFGSRGGEEQGTFWEFRLVWHPEERRVLLFQYGATGVLGVGPMERTGPGETRLDQTFYGPDGSSSRVVHETDETSEDVHVTRSFDLSDDGSLTPRRSYTWHRETGP